MANADLSRLINSDEVQSKVNAPKEGQAPKVLKLNPLKSAKAMEALNPGIVASKKRAAEAKGKKAKKQKSKALSEGKKAYYKSMIAEE